MLSVYVPGFFCSMSGLWDWSMLLCVAVVFFFFNCCIAFHCINLSLLLHFFFLFRATSAAYGSSQSRGLIRATAAGLCHSHSQARSEPCLRPTLQLTATLDPQPLSGARDWIHNPHGYQSGLPQLSHKGKTCPFYYSWTYVFLFLNFYFYYYYFLSFWLF